MKRNDKRRNAPAGFSTRAIHLGYDPASEQGALTPPIFMTSTYAFDREWSARVRWNNVFNRDYELVQNFNTPGSNVFVAVQYQPK